MRISDWSSDVCSSDLGTAQESGPNALLRLMRSLRDHTRGLVLLTATPMQVHPVEVWDLLSLLGLPPEWHERAFLSFFEDIVADSAGPDAVERMALMFRAATSAFGPADVSPVAPLGTRRLLPAAQV